jgi:hypothetical protein
MASSNERLKGQSDIENSLNEFIRIQSGKEETVNDPNSHSAIAGLSADIFIMLIGIEEKNIKKGQVIQHLVKNKDALLLLAKCHPDQKQLRKDITDKKFLQLDVIMRQMESGRNPLFSGPRHKQFIQWQKDLPPAAFAKDCNNLANNMSTPKANFASPNLLLLQLNNLVKWCEKSLTSQSIPQESANSFKKDLVTDLLKNAITPMIKAMPTIASPSSNVSAANQADFAIKLVDMLQILDKLTNSFNDEHIALIQAVITELTRCLRMSTDLYKEISATFIPQAFEPGTLVMTDEDPLNTTISELEPELWLKIFPQGLPALPEASSISVGDDNSTRHSLEAAPAAIERISSISVGGDNSAFSTVATTRASLEAREEAAERQTKTPSPAPSE